MKNAIFPHMSLDSRVWVYQTDRLLSAEEAVQIQSDLDEFVQAWSSHQQLLTASAKVHLRHFVVLCVDEQHIAASGCSIDSAVHFLQSLEDTYQLSLFERTHVAYISDDEIVTAPQDLFFAKLRSGEITEDTLVFDNLVNDLQAFCDGHLKPLSQSWLLRLASS